MKGILHIIALYYDYRMMALSYFPWAGACTEPWLIFTFNHSYEVRRTGMMFRWKVKFLAGADMIPTQFCHCTGVRPSQDLNGQWICCLFFHLSYSPILLDACKTPRGCRHPDPEGSTLALMQLPNMTNWHMLCDLIVLLWVLLLSLPHMYRRKSVSEMPLSQTKTWPPWFCKSQRVY